jgi:predicted ferric reductase
MKRLRRQQRTQGYLAITFFIINVLGITVWWWINNRDQFTNYSGVMIALGRITGFLAAFGALTQLLLMAKIYFIEQLFAYSTFLKVHKYVGYTVLGSILLHPFFLVLGYRLNGQPSIIAQYIDFITHYEDVLKAAIASVLFITVVVSSIAIVRLKLRYETWYLVHLFSYLAIVLAFGHQVHAGGDFINHPLSSLYWYALYAFVFFSIGFSRFILPVWRSYSHSLRVGHIMQETHDTFSIYVTGKRLKDLGASSGQFFNWRFLAKGHILQSHPFSLSATPTESSLRFTYKILGDYTKELQYIKPGTRVILEGPHGTLTLKEAKTKNLLFIAGGIGITPLRAMIEALRPDQTATLLYSAKQPHDFSFVPEFEKLLTQKNFKIIYFPSKQRGRLQNADLLQHVGDGSAVDVFLCGPDTMMHDLKRALKKLHVPAQRIHFEGFSY